MNRRILPTRGLLRLFACTLGACVLSSCKEASAPAANITVTPGSADLVIGESRQFTAVGGGTSVVWSSSVPAVASVIPQTGFVQALSRGQTTIRAAAGGASGTAEVNVQAPAAIALSAPTAAFTVPVGAGDPAPRTIMVTNAGDRPLGAMSLGPTAYGQGEPTGWLTTALSGSAPPFTVTLTPRVGSLGRGTYTAIVPVLSAGVANSPQNVAVTFSIQAPASITLSRTAVTIPAIPGETKTELVNITNGGDVPLTGLSAAITFAQGQNWLTASLNTTSAPATLTLQATSGALAVGTYNATVRVSSTVSGVAPRDVTVQLVVSPGPSIQVPSTLVSVTAQNGTNAGPQTVNITNGGGGTLSGLTLGTITYGAGASGWLSPAPQLSGGTAPATLTLNFTSAALATGTYTATLPISSPVASNSPLNLQVQLTIGPPPNLSLNPTSANFSAWGNGPLPQAQPVQVTNSGNPQTITGLQASISYGTGSGWLTANFQGNVTTTPTTLLIQPTTTNLNAGTYTATVTVSGAGVSSKTVSVSYTVQTFTANVYPYLNNCSSGCHSTAGPSVTSSPNTALNVYNGVLPYTGSGTNGLYCNLFDPSAACSHGGGKYNSNTAMMNAIVGWLSNGAPYK